MSLPLRLSLILSLIVAVAWILGVAYSLRSTSQSIHSIYDADMRRTAERLMAVFSYEKDERYNDDDGRRHKEYREDDYHDDEEHDEDDHKRPELWVDRGTIGQTIRSMSDQLEVMEYLVIDPSGKVLYQSQHANPAEFPPPLQEGLFRVGDQSYYFLRGHDGDANIYLQEKQSARRTILVNAFLDQLKPLLIILPLTIFAIWFVVKRALQPVSRLRDEIGKRGDGNLEPIPDEHLPRELAAINTSVNLLLERVRKTLRAERNFISQAAHELRTPVAATMVQVDRLMQEVKDSPSQARANDIQDSLMRLKRLMEKLLQLAKAEGGLGELRPDIDLRTVVKLVVEEVQMATSTDAKVDVKLPETPVYLPIDADGFAILTRNLVENAILHGTKGKPIRVALGADGTLSVQNDCPAISESKLAKLQAADGESSPSLNGNGLGLTIAQKIALGSGMVLELQSPISGKKRGFSAVARMKKN